MSQPSSYVLLLSGTHVTGKETLAVSISQSLTCPWIKAEMCHGAASFGARSQSKKGYSYSSVFGRIWLSKIRRLGFLSDGYESDGESETGGSKFNTAPRRSEGKCTALMTCYAMRKPARDAIREVMLANGFRTVFVIMQITEKVLGGRTLGAEEESLAERIMGEKIEDIRVPVEEEEDVILIDSMRDVDALFVEIMEGVGTQTLNM